MKREKITNFKVTFQANRPWPGLLQQTRLFSNNEALVFFVQENAWNSGDFIFLKAFQRLPTLQFYTEDDASFLLSRSAHNQDDRLLSKVDGDSLSAHNFPRHPILTLVWKLPFGRLVICRNCSPSSNYLWMKFARRKDVRCAKTRPLRINRM